MKTKIVNSRSNGSNYNKKPILTLFLCIRLCMESIFFIKSFMFAGILVLNCPLNVAMPHCGISIQNALRSTIVNYYSQILQLWTCQKVNVNWAPFLDIPIRTQSNSRSKSQNQGTVKMNEQFCSFYDFDIELDRVMIKKKMRPLYYHTFLQGL